MWVYLAALYLMTAGQLDRRERLRLRIGKRCVTCVAHVHSGDSEKRSVPLVLSLGEGESPPRVITRRENQQNPEALPVQ